ncbi:hypothetical protein T492DRAFT_515054 [Pavlovales sp. CCMP2436]|nr:hypothetical protein T492DRAFT_515054 [Pavlovales sp. CCMP2436]
MLKPTGYKPSIVPLNINQTNSRRPLQSLLLYEPVSAPYRPMHGVDEERVPLTRGLRGERAADVDDGDVARGSRHARNLCYCAALLLLVGAAVAAAGGAGWAEALEEDEAMARALNAEGPPPRVSLAEALRHGLLPDAPPETPATAAPGGEGGGPAWRGQPAPLVLYTARNDLTNSLRRPCVATIATRPMAPPPFSPMRNHAGYCLSHGYDYAGTKGTVFVCSAEVP